MILIIDNYDSFTYNLVQYYRELSKEVVVYRNDQISIAQIKSLDPELIVLSPGPGTPKDSGICLPILKNLYTDTPIFGVCLGMQIIVEFFGGSIVSSGQPMHGINSSISHNQTGVFQNLPSPLSVTRYHSLAADKCSFPDDLLITAETNDQLIMAVKHTNLAIEGVQFHPEAILTEHGFEIVQNSLLLNKPKEVIK
ncbi:aminodeoxychorismate/anthranilate synthase component II [Gracilibacillus oryzae]|uniref:Aminodeoxychorismate/anthranilate synthase component II n=1 Tax=Gracilibacillus oryzae TaxID=1672701 RepID=A0A7C8KPJ1_9BACI|nr:aminodeoxychorismate/anthranilate synthase component II [Gracilibacillus oryzae]KAB8131756.1 aminodeoxychorismate/anthranilate synthase component II [Gracilibacillus oryzae]